MLSFEFVMIQKLSGDNECNDQDAKRQRSGRSRPRRGSFGARSLEPELAARIAAVPLE